MYPYQPYFNQQTQYQRTEVVKVNGEGGAKAYQMPPNSSVLLLGETAPIVWLKTTDGAAALAAGTVRANLDSMPPLRLSRKFSSVSTSARSMTA